MLLFLCFFFVVQILTTPRVFSLVFSYDMRPKRTEQTPHWKDTEYLNERAMFRTIMEPATLNIDHVEERDEGDYRCRVDFTKSPTRNSRIQLTVIGELFFSKTDDKLFSMYLTPSLLNNDYLK